MLFVQKFPSYGKTILNAYKKLVSNPLFLIGLIVRLTLVTIIAPTSVDQWYSPFLENSVQVFSFDPWQRWLSSGGMPIAFPYGYAMWIFFLPLTIVCKLTGISFAYGYGITLIAADFGLLLLLKNILKSKNWTLLLIYWLSPISLIASYCLGFNDIVPVFMLFTAIYLLKEQKLLLAGLILISAISAKLSMLVSLPFFLIYLFHSRSLKQIFPQFLYGLFAGLIIFFLPFLWSQAGISMIISNPFIENIYQISVSLFHNTYIYLLPLAYLLIIYTAWRIKHMNFELFNAILGIAFLVVVLLTPMSPGWFIWILPLIVAYQISSDVAAIYLTAIFSTLYALSALFFISQNSANTELLGGGSQFINIDRLSSLIYTALVAVGIVLAIRICRETIIRNDYFRLSRKPLVIGIAGDSGSGKDTLANAIAGLFGQHSVASISGDDYHLWDRHQPMWEIMTHINPAANDLESFAKNLIALTDGKPIQASRYDHDSGKMSRPFTIRSNDLIIASGLHALHLPILRECYDLSIYLNIDEDLRTFFKVQRDVIERGYNKERVIEYLAMRKPDSDKFIKPQSAFADLIISLRPITPKSLLGADKINAPRLKLGIQSRHGFNEASLTRVLVGVCGLHIDINTNADTSEVELTIEGEASWQDIELAAKLICPEIFEFLDLKPKWQSGVLGLMQLVTLSHINQALTRRYI
jgi:uridine kinase